MENVKFKAKITDESHFSFGKIVDVEWINLKKREISFHGRAYGLMKLMEHATEGQFKLLSYTGFKDMDGNELYEGQIIKIYDDEEADNGWEEKVIRHLGAFFAGDDNFIGNVHFRSRVIGYFV